ncbi:uncharacterized protein [Physcomitrium patens]|uniref:Uncharacterized protein n=1 Tax=Physcomitrium patens TaxID=3218 RepID=A0A2K1JCS3_PHYPA|nr:uncharacterized protein LOC112292797 isoform X1 [Physcomitrium patens]PNR39323.1 hypothetical protein PHYPA_019601 [Physcomitrium patens]|eukprot:XP_024397389.1 uncharacterized protein LOC112292797 isoform X1 [Physcomitrella patens]
MAATMGVGPLGALTAIPATSSLLERNIGANKPARTTTSLKTLCHGFTLPLPKSSQRLRSAASFRVRADTSDRGPEDGATTSVVDKTAEKTEVDRLMDGLSFGQLCDEFECISSPAVERTARQLVKDIIDLREGERSLSNFGVNVEYKDPLRSFKGRDKYKGANWIKTALEKPTVAVREMKMISTSVLKIKWTVTGTPKLPPASALGGRVVLAVSSTFTMNQISGQVTLHEDEWDLSASDPAAQAYFWTARLAFSAVEGGKNFASGVQGIAKQLDKGQENNSNSIYPDPSGDPRKFFQMEDNPQKDLYQVGLVVALLYLLVQFLKLTL